jgi:hypothetical protein
VCGHVTGKREWPAFKAWFARNLEPALKAWMGTVDVVYDGDERLDPSRKYVFGYAPHGLFPIGPASWFYTALDRLSLAYLGSHALLQTRKQTRFERC